MRVVGFVLGLFLFLPYVLAAERIRVGLLPILDGLPVYVAEEMGYFKEGGVNVEVVPCASASERDQLLAGGKVDVVINDAVSLALLNRERPWVVGMRYAFLPTRDYAQFFIISSPKSNIKAVSDLKGVPIGVSEATIVHYVTERLLERQGFSKTDIKIVPVLRIPDRLSALLRGELSCATFPDPFGTLAMMQGGRLILDDRRDPSFSGSLYSATEKFARERSQALRGFLSSIDRAIKEVNGNKGRWERLVFEKKLIPSPLQGAYRIPDFPPPGVPTREQWTDVLLWLRQKGIARQGSSYEESIRPEYGR
jgi:NitT/TauT family transport system substrate-binding protein